MLVGQGFGWPMYVVRLGWAARGRGGFKGTPFPSWHTPELPDLKASETKKPLDILTSCPPGPAVALPAARRPPGENQTLRGQVSVPKQETDTGLWGSPVHARAARDRWSRLKGDTLDSASAQHRLTRAGSPFGPPFSHLQLGTVIPTHCPLGSSWSYMGSACRGGGPLWGSGSHGRWVAPAMHPAWVCLPRWARSEMTSLFSQSFRPAVTRQAVSRHRQGGQGWAAGPAPIQGKSPQRSHGVCPPLMASLPAEGPGISPPPLPAGPLSWRFMPRVSFLLALLTPVLNSSPEAEARFLLGPHQGLGAATSRQPLQGGSWPRHPGRWPPLLPAPRSPQEPLGTTSFPVGVVGPVVPNLGQTSRCPGELHQILGPRAPSRLPEWDPPDATCPQCHESSP